MTLVILCTTENQVTLIYQDRKRECQRNIEEDQQQIFQETLEAQRTYFLRSLKFNKYVFYFFFNISNSLFS